jgi:cob(I)alamin adenosyltransferase
MKIYTKNGDKGTTSLIGGERVSKADPRVEAYGTVDELAAHLALWADMMRQTLVSARNIFTHSNVRVSAARLLVQIADAVDEIQKDLMAVEAVLATGAGAGDGGVGGKGSKVAPLPETAIKRLESQIDAMSEGLPPLGGFTLPGGHPVVSQSHVCRTVCRRAERAIVRASEQRPLPSEPARYLNRLSDWLYAAGRKAAGLLEVKEIYWIP